ncbi:MAG: PBSX family phage terminase large subunit [Planctomycetes bacterium]|nr:PBSX family phage terminase large subunit [Planctomycetota bacterium]
MLIERNTVFKPFYESGKKYNILRGGSGSGKSYAVADDVILRTLNGAGKSRTIVARKVAATMRQSVFELLKRRIADMGASDLFTINKTEMIFSCRGGDIILVGLDDADKLKSIYDPTDAWIEEADQVSQADFEEIDRRIRTITDRKPKITLSFNPTSVYSWLKAYWYDNDYTDGDVYEQTTTYLDNRFLDPNYAATIERLKETNRSAYRVYGLGEWGIVEGVVFDDWAVADIPNGTKSIGYGMDFGYTNDPTTLIQVFETAEAYYYDEIIYQSGLTNPEISATLKDRGISHYADIIADSAEPKSIEELHRMGWNIYPCKKGADSIRFGISAMKTKKQYITPRSTNLQREFSSYCWKQDKNGKWLPEPVDMFNHGIDAIRYRVDKRRPIRAGASAGALGL